MSPAEIDVQKKETQYLLAELDAAIITKPLIIAVLVAGMCQFLIGYNTGVINASYDVIFTSHSTFQWSLAIGAFALGGFLGACLATNVDTRGRANSLVAVSTLFLLGSLIQTSSSIILQFSIGRFNVGVASGLSTVLLPLYLGELAPPTLRGTLGTFTQFSFVSGILVSNLMAFQFVNEYLFHLSVVVSFMQLLASLFLTDSPIWMLKNDPKSEQTQETIKKIRGLRYGHEVDTETNLIIHASHVQCCSNNDDILRKIIQDKTMRKLLICSLFLQVAQQFSGINAVFCYSSMVFDGLNVDALLGTSAVGGINVVATYLAMLIMEKSNRKTILLCSTGGMLLSTVPLILCMQGYLNKMLSVYFVVCYVASYAVGLGKL
jgi:SP family facilitated glucose transporter-like MFS transporter 3